MPVADQWTSRSFVTFEMSVSNESQNSQRDAEPFNDLEI
jgi:hypothetical protein